MSSLSTMVSEMWDGVSAGRFALVTCDMSSLSTTVSDMWDGSSAGRPSRIVFMLVDDGFWVVLWFSLLSPVLVAPSRWGNALCGVANWDMGSGSDRRSSSS